jgi:hypothetical protein
MGWFGRVSVDGWIVGGVEVTTGTRLQSGRAKGRCMLIVLMQRLLRVENNKLQRYSWHEFCPLAWLQAHNTKSTYLGSLAS